MAKKVKTKTSQLEQSKKRIKVPFHARNGRHEACGRQDHNSAIHSLAHHSSGRSEPAACSGNSWSARKLCWRECC